MTDSHSDDTEHDAVLRVFDASDRLGKKMIGWKWSDGRPTMSPDEHGEADRLIEEAENRIDLSDLDHGTVVARIGMDGETVESVEWDDRYIDKGSEDSR